MSISTIIFQAVKKANSIIPNTHTRKLKVPISPMARLQEIANRGYRILEVKDRSHDNWRPVAWAIEGGRIRVGSITGFECSIMYFDNTIDKFNHLKNIVYENFEFYNGEWMLVSRRTSRDTQAKKNGIPIMANLDVHRFVYKHIFEQYHDVDDTVVTWTLREVNAFIQELMREQNRMINGGSVGYQIDSMFSMIAPGLDWAIENNVYLETLPLKPKYT